MGLTRKGECAFGVVNMEYIELAKIFKSNSYYQIKKKLKMNFAQGKS